MARRVSLPAADDLFRPTGPEGADGSAGPGAAEAAVRAVPDAATAEEAASTKPAASGRVRHDEKMTVYVTAEELMAIEQARLTLRGEHRLAVDRGRLVREAVALVLADLATHREESMLVPPARRPVTGEPHPQHRRAARGHPGVLAAPGQLRGALRPAAQPDLQAQARHHRGRAVAGDRRVHRPRQGRRVGLGPGADDVLPPGRCDAARPQGRSPAAAGRRRGRGGPRPARGARPALRPPHPVQGLQAGGRASSAPAWPTRLAATRGRSVWRTASPGCCPRCSSASAWSSSPPWPPRRWRPSRCSRWGWPTSTPRPSPSASRAPSWSTACAARAR